MFKLALKNTTRNLRRTLLTAFAVFIATFVVMTVAGYMNSVVADMLDNTVLHSTGHIRVRKANYSKYEDVLPLQFSIENTTEVATAIEALEEVEHVERLSNVTVSVYLKESLKSVQTVVVDPSTSNFTIGKGITLTEGRLMDSEAKEIMVSQKFLSDNGLKVGDTVTLISRTAQSGTNGCSFTIVGVVDSMDASYVSSIIYMSTSRFSKLAHLEDGAIELLVTLYDESQIDEVTEKIENVLAALDLDLSEYELKSWHKISVTYQMIIVYKVMIVFIEVLFFFIASTLVVNTTLMGVMERKKEISTLATIGYSRGKIRFLFVEETTLIAVLGCIVAIIVGLISFHISSTVGIDITLFGADQVSGWGFSKMIYPTLAFSKMILYSLVMLAVTIVAALFATRHVKAIEIADALREEN